jgi:hypothetical protein
VEVIIVGFDAAGQLLTIKYSAFVRYMIKNEVGYAVYNTINAHICVCTCCRSYWPHCLRHGSVVTCLLRLWVSIQLGARRQGCLSVVSVVCHQVEVSTMSRSLVQQSPTFYGMSECDSNTTESIILKFLYQY